MTNKHSSSPDESVGMWAKRCYLAGRTMMDAALRPFGLGVTQWYVLHKLMSQGPTMQRELLRMLQVERATLSAVVASLVRKGLVEQVPDKEDQRQKLLRPTAAGKKLWKELPDLSYIPKVAFKGVAEADLATAMKVLRAATERLNTLIRNGTDE